MMGLMGAADKYVLAGFVVGSVWTPPPDQVGTLPAAVMTVSKCLVDLLYATGRDTIPGPWFSAARDATAARDEADLDGVRVIAVHVERSDRDMGHPRGFEVVGFESGRLHSWLCYDLRKQTLEPDTGWELTELGLLKSDAQARAVATAANMNRGTDTGTPLEVTWFPVLLAE